MPIDGSYRTDWTDGTLGGKLPGAVMSYRSYVSYVSHRRRVPGTAQGIGQGAALAL